MKEKGVVRDWLSSARSSGAEESTLLLGELMAKLGVSPLLKMKWVGYLLAIVLVGAATALGVILNWYDAKANIIMLYLLCVVFVATTFSRGAAFLASVAGVLLFDFFFVPPYFQITLNDAKYLFILAVFLGVAVLVSQLSARAREREVLAQEKAKVTDAQYCLSRELSLTRAVDELLSVAAHHISDVFHCPVAVLMPQDGSKTLSLVASHPPLQLNAAELDAAQDAFDQKHATIPSRGRTSIFSGLYLPLTGAQKTVGVVGLMRSKQGVNLDPSQMNLLLAFANHTAVALERAQLWKASEDANLRAEREKLRSALLSSVSHDLRTPLTTITGAASSLLASFDAMSPETAKELLESIYEEADRLNRLVGNLLDMTKLQSGVVSVKKDWYSLEEVVGAAITRLEKKLRDHRVVTELPENLPLIAIDPTLVEQLFINLLENAAKYSEPGNEIRISASASERLLTVEVFNSGSRLPEGAEQRVFEKFFRGRQTVSGRGVGLGLAICQAIVKAHGGSIFAENRDDNCVNFLITFPIEEGAPKVEIEMEAAEANK